MFWANYFCNILAWGWGGVQVEFETNMTIQLPSPSKLMQSTINYFGNIKDMELQFYCYGVALALYFSWDSLQYAFAASKSGSIYYLQLQFWSLSE